MEIHKKFKLFCQLKFKQYYKKKSAIYFQVTPYSIWRWYNAQRRIPEKIVKEVNNFFKRYPEKLREDS